MSSQGLEGKQILLCYSISIWFVLSRSTAIQFTLQDAGQGGSEVQFQNWPTTLILQLIPKDLAQTIGSHFFKNSKSVLFHPEPSESLDALTKTLSSGYAGCVHFTGMANFKIHDLTSMIGRELLRTAR